MCALPDHLAAELHGAAVVDRDLLDATADPFARLEHEHVRAAVREIARGGEPGQAGPDDDDVASRRHRLVVGEDAQRVGGQMRGHGGADVVLLHVARVRDERLHAIAAGKRDEDLRRRAEVDEALDRRGHAVLARRRRRLDADALGPDGEANDARARASPCAALSVTPPTSTRPTVEHARRA